MHQIACDLTREEMKKHNINGRWMDEPDRFEFKRKGLNCLLSRVPGTFHWCGYVGVPLSHPAAGKNYDDVHVEVHGGLTYGAECHSKICHIPDKGEEDHLFWLGFDCAHAGDIMPGMEIARATISELMEIHKEFEYLHTEDQYRDINFVMNETIRLADQLELLK